MNGRTAIQPLPPPPPAVPVTLIFESAIGNCMQSVAIKMLSALLIETGAMSGFRDAQWAQVSNEQEGLMRG